MEDSKAALLLLAAINSARDVEREFENAISIERRGAIRQGAALNSRFPLHLAEITRTDFRRAVSAAASIAARIPKNTVERSNFRTLLQSVGIEFKNIFVNSAEDKMYSKSSSVVFNSDVARIASTLQNEIDEICDRAVREMSVDLFGRPDDGATTTAGERERATLDYVSQSRIAELRSLKSATRDFRRLVQLCAEINTSFERESYLSVAALVRTILNHVPPIFGQKSFAQVAAQHGERSFKAQMLHMENSLRNVADSHLHHMIERHEDLPTFQQIDFRSDLDVLLGEIIRQVRTQG